MKIDEEYAPELSAVLRYHPELFTGVLGLDNLREVSLREGFRIIPLEPFQGVEIFVLDESTGMQTGTYKSLDGCVTAAFCRQNGFAQVAFSSGANGGRALTEYGRHVGIETFFFSPPTTLFKLPGELFRDRQAHLISVEGSDRRVKEATALFAKAARIPVVPLLQWRLLASSVRGLFIAEWMVANGHHFDWFVQAVCAGFGPIGLYRALLNLVDRNGIKGASIPRFLGIQQAALDPIALAWAAGQERLSQPLSWKSDSPIEPSLYNTCPRETYPILKEMIEKVGGHFLSVEEGDYEQWSQEYLLRLQLAGIELTRREGSEELLEKAGLLAGAGLLKGIDSGRIRPGRRVLCSLSGGAARPSDQAAVPQASISAEEDLQEAVKVLVEETLPAVTP